jgi:hypothetical protein
MRKYKLLAALIAVFLGIFSLAPAEADSPEIDFLKSYVGNWEGTSALVGGEHPEPFHCRLKISPGNQGKINYAGRCSLVSMNLSVSGTIAFDEAKKRYFAAMSSNAGFTGTAVGQRAGDTISFDLRDKQQDRGGNDVRIGARIVLTSGSIAVDFEVEFNNSGQVLTTSVPFKWIG